MLYTREDTTGALLRGVASLRLGDVPAVARP
jgi:hypothetical protein